jgi:DNA repair ATPase RecN
MMSIDDLVTVFVAIAGSTGFWGVLQLFINRKGRKADAAKQVADNEHTRNLLLADAQAIAQKTALDSAERSYQQVRRECGECRTELRQMREATETLIVAIEEFALVDLGPEGKVRLREAIRVARHAM